MKFLNIIGFNGRFVVVVVVTYTGPFPSKNHETTFHAGMS